MNLLWHFTVDSIGRLTGLRDRCRCPKCAAVGTWKPHGGWFDFGDVAGRLRWMCKCCGWYVDERGSGWVRPHVEKKVWDFPGNGADGDLPKDMLGAAKLWPWRG